MFTFAHLADCHLGAWRDEKMRQCGVDSFIKTIDICIQKKVDFILISGDLFNTALPAIEIMRETVKQLHKAKMATIPVYIIAGSHDYSAAGKTMLHVLEEAQLVQNVVKGNQEELLTLEKTVDSKTGTKIYGLFGKARSLEKHYYESLNREPIEKEEGFKIFMFHSAITELKPKEIADSHSAPLSLFPKNCNYYAGGHVHYRYSEQVKDYGLFCYPGPVFPNSFSELEELKTGSFVLNTVENNKIKSEYISIKSHPVICKSVNVTNKTESQIKTEIENWDDTFENSIVTIRFIGKLLEKIPQIHLPSYFTMINSAKLEYPQFEMESVQSEEHVEDTLISQQENPIQIKEYMTQLDIQKQDGETQKDFEKRVQKIIE